MTGLGLSPAALGLLRALVARSGAPRDHILITDGRSTDWRSLTFDGERHRIALRIVGEHHETFAGRMVHRIEDAEFVIPGIIVADVHVAERQWRAVDGSTELTIEALTVASD